MADAVDLKCPECGARIHAHPGSDVARCEYCGTQTRVQRRDGVFERPVVQVNVPAQFKNLPVAIQTHTKRFVWFMVLTTVGLPIAIMVTVGYFTCQHKNKIKQRIEAAQQKARSRHSWSAHDMLADVNGDNIADVVGRITYFRSAPNVVWAAIDGKTGAQLWQTPFIHHKKLTYSRAGIVGNVFLVADSLGSLTARKLSDGSVMWKAPLGERVARICAGPPGHAVLDTKDKRRHVVSLKDGGVRDVANAECGWAATDKRDAVPKGIRKAKRSIKDGGYQLNTLPGMYVSKVWVRTADKMALAIGNRTPGTRVPMIARFEVADRPEQGLTRPERPKRRRGRRTKEYWQAIREYSAKLRAYRKAVDMARAKLLWKVDVPGVHALKASTSTPDKLAVAESVIVVAYALRSDSKKRVAAFAIADGKRLWDVEVPKYKSSHSIKHVHASKTHVFVSLSDQLVAFELADGKLAFSVGRE